MRYKRILVEKLTTDQLNTLISDQNSMMQGAWDINHPVIRYIANSPNFTIHSWGYMFHRRKGLFVQNLRHFMRPDIIKELATRYQDAKDQHLELSQTFHQVDSLIDLVIGQDQYEYLSEHKEFLNIDRFQNLMALHYPQRCRALFQNNNKFIEKFCLDVLDHRIGKKR